MKEAYDVHFAATIERAEKQIILAKHGRRILNLLDDTPLVPGDARAGFEHSEEARQMLNDAEAELQAWQPTYEPVRTTPLGNNLMPSEETSATETRATESVPPASDISVIGSEGAPATERGLSEGDHLAQATGSHAEAPETTSNAHQATTSPTAA